MSSLNLIHPPTPAAEYVRMSTQAQEYSIENQRAKIRNYALGNGYEIVRTYSDAGRSGLRISNRPGLQGLLADVLSGNVIFRTILVYDVSRWGRFQDADQAAHYEFVCKQAGIPVIYCAEPFGDAPGPLASIAKALKRSMASEYSRELGVRVFAGQERIAQMGFKIGGLPGYGLRRAVISTDGKQKRLLSVGERKGLTSDRVILVPGAKREVEGVRLMFLMAHRGLGCPAIARELNRLGIKRRGPTAWNRENVRSILTHPKYAGWNVWGRTSQRLTNRCTVVPEPLWVKRPASFHAVIDQHTFDLVQRKLRSATSERRWSGPAILARLKQLLRRKGRLSEHLINSSKRMPCPSTIQHYFESLPRAYELIGYTQKNSARKACQTRRRMFQLRRSLIREICSMFQKDVQIVRLPGKLIPLLRVDDKINVSLQTCPATRTRQGLSWTLNSRASHPSAVTLLVRSNSKYGRYALDVFPPRKWATLYHFRRDAQWMAAGTRLRRLQDFCRAVRAAFARAEKGDQE